MYDYVQKVCLKTGGPRKPMKHDKPYDRSVFQSLMLISQFGINMVVPIGMMTALGIYLDNKFGTTWITVVLFFVGAIAGGQNIYRMAKRFFTDHEDSGNSETKE